MLPFALSAIVLASIPAALAAPFQERSSIAGIPYSKHSLAITTSVPRSARKSAQLRRYMDILSSTTERYVDDGATDEFDGPGSGVEYAVNITVAGQNVSVIFDTGSSDLWFPASNFTCLLENGTVTDQAECYFGPTYFDVQTALSKGYITPVDFVDNFNISYGDGEFVTGSAYIGSVEFAGITVNNSEFSAGESAYWEGDGVTDGLIGFANPLLTSVFAGSNPTLDSNNNSRLYDPWFYQAVADGFVAPYFSIALNRVSIAAEVEDDGYAVLEGLGSVTLGGLPSESSVPLTGKSVTVPNVLFNVTIDGKNMTVPAYYTVPVTSWNFPGSDLVVNNTSPLTILDSGTTLIYAPNTVAEAFNAQIVPLPEYDEDEGVFFVDCDAHIPDLSVTIGGEEFAFTREDLVYAYDETNTICLSSVVPGGDEINDIFILGDRFLVNVVASFNIQGNNISIFERAAYTTSQ